VIDLLFELILDALFLIPNLIISLIPDTGFVLPSYIGSMIDVLKVPMSIFPLDLWFLIISQLSFWYVLQLSWSIIEWLYKKIPGVD